MWAFKAFHAEVYTEFVHIRVDGEDRSFDLRGISSCTCSSSVGKRRGKGGKVIQKIRESRRERKYHVAIKILTAMAMHARLTYGESRSPVRWCPMQGEYMSAFLFDGYDINRIIELTYPRTLEEDPQKPGFDQQMRNQL